MSGQYDRYVTDAQPRKNRPGPLIVVLMSIAALGVIALLPLNSVDQFEVHLVDNFNIDERSEGDATLPTVVVVAQQTVNEILAEQLANLVTKSEARFVMLPKPGSYTSIAVRNDCTCQFYELDSTSLLLEEYLQLLDRLQAKIASGARVEIVINGEVVAGMQPLVAAQSQLKDKFPDLPVFDIKKHAVPDPEHRSFAVLLTAETLPNIGEMARQAERIYEKGLRASVDRIAEDFARSARSIAARRAVLVVPESLAKSQTVDGTISKSVQERLLVKGFSCIVVTAKTK